MLPIMDNFPQELLHCIVDCFQDDRRALATVRLVSRAWNFSARPHLFRSLDLLISESPVSGATCHSSGGPFCVPKIKYRGVEKFKTLLSILDSGHGIAHCVRQISLGRTSTFSSTDPESNKQQNTYVLLISSILRRFSHLSAVVFREMNWSNLASSFSSFILQTCKIRTLEQIEIWNCQMPTTSSLLDFLGASRNVKSLRLSYFRILAADTDVENNKLASSMANGVDRSIECSSDTEPCTSLLHSLAIDTALDVHNIFGMRPSLINFLNLRRLYLGNVHDTTGVAEFLRRAGHSLEYLDMRLIPNKQTQPRLSAVDLELSHCPRLQHLRISGLHWTPSLCPSEYLTSLFTKSSDQSLPIECLQLMVTVIKPKVMTPVGLTCINSPRDSETASPPTLSRPTELQYSDWTILDTILSSRTFQVLKSFHISLKTIREREVDPSTLSGMFPKLMDKGVQVMCT